MKKAPYLKLLKRLSLEGCIVTIDAMGADKKIASAICEQKADYLLAIKDNQKHTKQSIEDFFEIFIKDNQHKTPHDVHQTIDKQRQGVIVRTCYVFEQLTCLYQPQAWQNIHSFVVVVNETHPPNHLPKALLP